MRYLEIAVPEGTRRSVLDILEDEGIDYVVSDETSGRGYSAVVRFPLPTRAVEHVLDRLHRAGIGEETRVVIVNAETVISQRFEDLLEQYSHGGTKGARTSSIDQAPFSMSMFLEWTDIVASETIYTPNATSSCDRMCNDFQWLL